MTIIIETHYSLKLKQNKFLAISECFQVTPSDSLGFLKKAF